MKCTRCHEAEAVSFYRDGGLCSSCAGRMTTIEGVEVVAVREGNTARLRVGGLEAWLNSAQRIALIKALGGEEAGM